MGVDFLRRVRSRLLRRGLFRRVSSTAACLVLVATSITVPAVVATTALPPAQGGTLPSAAATNHPAMVKAAPTLPLRFVDDASGSNVTVRPTIAPPAPPSVKTEVASMRSEYSRTTTAS